MDINHNNKRDAEAEAIRIAKEFVSFQGSKDWTCIGAQPDRLAANYRRRKSIVKWSVIFNRAIGDEAVDGPAVIKVDIETGEAEFF